METAKHTPGPWRLDKEYGETDCWALDAPTHGAIAQIVVSMRDKEERNINGQLEANAKLIAAAPDMLEALEKIRVNIEAVTELGFGKASLRIVKEAIDKATK